MIMTVEELMKLPEFSSLTESDVKNRLKSVELMIRSYTHNNFQNRFVRFTAESAGNVLAGAYAFLKVGDTVQISQSQVNDGLYVITTLDSEGITVDAELFDSDFNLVTKVEYPEDVKTGVVELLRWQERMKDKVGIKSETLSRYSVTYADADVNNQIMGYPAALLGFLKPYMKARF